MLVENVSQKSMLILRIIVENWKKIHYEIYALFSLLLSLFYIFF